MPEIAHVPGLPAHVRGMLNLRGNVIPLIDLRQLLGMPTASTELAEFRALMSQREQDHRNWIAELEASVRERREFHLATDPTKCAFGRWRAGYQPKNIPISELLNRFDAPHNFIHGVAQKAIDLLAAGSPNDALALIERARGKELALLLKLFAELDELLLATNREIAVVLGNRNRTVAVAIDGVESVERFAEDEQSMVGTIPGLAPTNIIRNVGRRANNAGLVMTIDCEHLLHNLKTEQV